MKVRADELQVGMLVDLEGDEWADPDRDHSEYEFGYSQVVEVTREALGSVLIEFTDACVAFPPEHMLEVRDE